MTTWKRGAGRILAGVTAAVALLAAGCVGDEAGAVDNGPSEEFFDATCPDNPDCFASECRVCPDYWVCEDKLDEGKRCGSPGPDYPGEGDWDCEDIDGKTVCRGSDMPDDGGGDAWDCVDRGEFVECTNDSPDYPDGEGDDVWDCYYEREFRICESGGSSGGDSGDGSGSSGSGGSDGSGGTYPPGGGDDGWDCIDRGEFVECEGGSSDDDGGKSDSSSGDFGDEPGDICFLPADEGAEGSEPVARAGFSFGTFDGADSVYIRLAFSESFVDNSYGVNSSDGYRGGNKGHTFTDLVKSDHAQVAFLDGSDSLVVEIKVDYISKADDVASGYRTLGIDGGDGALIAGDGSAVLHTMTSLDRNFNEHGCVYTEDSPTSAECPEWDNTMVYEIWLDRSAFGPSDFGRPTLDMVHASPSRMASDTIYVDPQPCP